MDTLPTPDQINVAVTHTSSAIAAVKVAWGDWAGVIALVYPAIVHAMAMFKSLQKVPVFGPVLNAIAGNYGAASNKP